MRLENRLEIIIIIIIIFESQVNKCAHYFSRVEFHKVWPLKAREDSPTNLLCKHTIVVAIYIYQN